MIQIALADDDVLLVKTFQAYFEKEFYFECVFCANTIQDLLLALQTENHLDYLFLDIDFGGISSIEFLPKIRSLRPEVEIIIFTHYPTDKNILKALQAGAVGFLPKTVKLKDLKKYIRIILKDGAAITPQIAKKLLKYIQPYSANFMDMESIKTKLLSLSSLDIKILEMLAEGYTYKEVSDNTALTIDGVRYHIKKIYKNLHVKNKVEAIQIFHSWKGMMK